MILVLDDVMSKEYSDSLDNFPYWLKFFYTEKTVYAGNEYEIYHDENILDSGQLSTPLYVLNEYKETTYDIITPILYVINKRFHKLNLIMKLE